MLLLGINGSGGSRTIGGPAVLLFRLPLIVPLIRGSRVLLRPVPVRCR